MFTSLLSELLKTCAKVKGRVDLGCSKRLFGEHPAGRESMAMTTIAVIYGYARVSKTDDVSKNLDTQLMLLAEQGIRGGLVYSDVASGRTFQRLS